MKIEDVEDLTKLNSDDLLSLGFAWWSQSTKHSGKAPPYLMLIPYELRAELGNRIPEGTILTDILGNESLVGTDEIDLDYRLGLLAYGWIPVDKKKGLK